jgi:hypothetical protein
MLLHEYNGDLQRTLAALLDGTAQDIKQCRPLHRYHFPECDTWTKEEIDAFTKAMETSEKNFLLVSRAVCFIELFKKKKKEYFANFFIKGWNKKCQTMY